MRNAHNFFDGCFALRDTTPAILPQSFHALGDGALFEFAAIALLHDQFPQRLGYDANFIDCGAALITGLPALITTDAATEPSAKFFYRKTDFAEIFSRIIHQLHAVCADRAHESLRYERFHYRGKQKRLDIHVEQARDAADRIVCMQRAENEVTGHGRPDCDIRGFDIANFADHNHIGILAQNMAETFCESEIDFWFDVDLRDTGNSIFDRFFDRDDAPLH